MQRAHSIIIVGMLCAGCVDSPTRKPADAVVRDVEDGDPCTPRNALPDPFVLLLDAKSLEIVTSGAVEMTDVVDVCGFVKRNRERTLPTITWRADKGLSTLHDRIAEACAIWRPLGVACIEGIADEPTDLEFHAEGSRCGPAKEGEACILGFAHGDGRVDLCLSQMAKDDVNGDPYDEFVAVVAHEIGHQLGIAHVPDDCDEVLETPFHGYIACGPALMNPCGTDIRGLMFADIVAFTVRDERRAVVSADAAAPPTEEE